MARLNEADIKALLKHYNIVKMRRITHTTTEDTGDDENAEPETTTHHVVHTTELVEEPETKEESLNRFLSYIGVCSLSDYVNIYVGTKPIVLAQVTFRLVVGPQSPPRTKGGSWNPRITAQ